MRQVFFCTGKPCCMLRKLLLVGLAIILSTWVLGSWFWLAKAPASSGAPLTISRQAQGQAAPAGSLSATNLLPDFFQQKYPPEERAQFHVSSQKPAAVFVLATGVQVRTEAGWQPYSEEPRNEIWRLRPGTAKDLYVQVPEKAKEETCRVYIRYAGQMHGARLFQTQAREAWQIRSLTNWTGQAWGGGRFSGRYECFSEEFSK